jgi:N-acetylglucosamine kinase-like BadF-type ATPase
MSECLIALDMGGTKTHIVVETIDGVRLVDTVISSNGWDAEPPKEGAAWIAERLRANVATDLKIGATAFGAQGVNSADIARQLEAELRAQGYPAKAVNDAALIVPAAGFSQGIGIIAGTGAIGVGADSNGNPLSSGGWGSVIGDEGGAAALVREAARAALRAADEGQPDDGLLGALIADFGVEDPERLTRRVNDDPTAENWAPHCPSVFAAADAGSGLAAGVIEDGARHLAALVSQLIARGAVGTDIVVAGSVIVNQKRLLESFKRSVGKTNPSLAVHVLDVSPVEGAVFLARNMLMNSID